MPFDRERPNLLGAGGFASDDDAIAQLRNLDMGPSVDVPSSADLGAVDSQRAGIENLPEKVVAVDGSRAEAPVDIEEINAQVGFIEIAVTTVDSALLRKYRSSGNRFVPPTIEDSSVDVEHVRMVLPSQNAYFNNKPPEPVGFREMLYHNFRDKEVRNTSLLKFMTDLLTIKGDVNNNKIRLKKCPYREESGCQLEHRVPVDSTVECQHTKNKTGEESPLFPTDRLRIYEKVSNRSTNINAMHLVMQVVEHLALGITIQDAARTNEASTRVSKTVFMKDGPLAQPDSTSAWISRGMSDFLYNLRNDGDTPIVVGFDKSGEFANFRGKIRNRSDSDGDKILEPDEVVPMSSEFIFERVKPRSSNEMFGRKSYYGKSFLYKSPSDYCFSLTIGPREYKDGATNGVKARPGHDNLQYKPSDYPTLSPAVAAVYDTELSLIKDSVIPIHLAHDRATIPERVGNKVLGELVDRELAGADRIYGE